MNARNPLDRTSILHPCHWMDETISDGRVYLIAWGGGLAEPVTTYPHETLEQAKEELASRLRSLGRRPE